MDFVTAREAGVTRRWMQSSRFASHDDVFFFLMRPVVLQKELERIAEERLAAEREATRTQRWELFRACGECAGWCFIGLFMMGLAVHTTDAELGGVLLAGGMLIGYVGMFTSLLSSYRRAHDRGDL
jgi:hypothetical protein